MELNNLVPFRHRRQQAAHMRTLSPFERMHEEMDRLFDDFLPHLSVGHDGETRLGSLASVDLSETDSDLELTADLPGMKEDDIDITLRDGALIISGERKHEAEEKKKNFYRSERVYGSFNRAITLPCDVDEDRIHANFKKGVLTVRLPKSKSAKENVRKIAIQAN